jgi:hypothetical protein
MAGGSLGLLLSELDFLAFMIALTDPDPFAQEETFLGKNSI